MDRHGCPPGSGAVALDELRGALDGVDGGSMVLREVQADAV
ncbi:hypothetical protein L493_4716, partial [Bordetella bronchiseptica 99-R-0433]